MTNSNAPVAFWNQSQRKTKLKHTLKWPNNINKLFSIGLLCGLLAGVVITALVAWYFLSPSGSSPTVFSPSAVCDVTPLDEETESDSDTAIVRFVAYGDMDSDDDVPCGMLPGVRIAIISNAGARSAFKERDNLLNWWTVVGGDELGIKHFVPPGVRVPTTADRLSEAPAQFVTTGPDGTAKLPINHEDDYSLCAISPVSDLILGCNHHLSPRASDDYLIVYIYLTRGHAIVEIGDSDRYQKFLGGVESSRELATVEFEATTHDDIEPSRPSGDLDIVIVDDGHVNAWWTAVFDNGDELEADRAYAGTEARTHDWVHVVTTGPDGLAETALLPGDYLICPVNWRGRPVCLYENLTSGHHKFNVNLWAGGNLHSIVRQVEAKPAEPDCDSPFHGLKLGALERHLIECAEEAEGR